MRPYSFDPDVVREIKNMANTVNPADYLPSESESLGSPEQQQQHHFDQVAAGLSRRNELAHSLRGVTDQDIDEGTLDERSAHGESLLNQLIAQAAQATDPAKRAHLQLKAQQVAEGLVTGQQSKPQQQDIDETSAYEQLNARGVDVQAAMVWAGEALSDESIEGFDALVKSKDQQLAYATTTMLDHARQNPSQYLNSFDEEITPIDDNLATEIAAEFGDEVAKIIHLTSHALASKVASPHEVFKLHQKDENVRRAMLALMQRGVIRGVI